MMMVWCFTSLSTWFKSYLDDGRVILKGSVQWSTIVAFMNWILPPAAFDFWLKKKCLIWIYSKKELKANGRAMIRQICNVRPQDIVTTRSSDLLVRLGIEDLDLILKERRLRWYGHVERSSGAIKTAFDIQVDGKRGPGRPKMTWKQLTERAYREWKLLAIDPHGRRTWRSGVRSAMRAASQLSGRGPTDVDVAPVPAR